MTTPKPAGFNAEVKYLCATLGINTVSSEQGFEPDVHHVAALIEAGALPADPSDCPEFARLIGQRKVDGGDES
ncbi:hypothetical protein [Streptomyces sp. NPDC003832]